jgi:hypothetical protein
VQHLCALGATPRHVFRLFPEPGVAGSIPAGGTTLMLHGALSWRGARQHSFRIGKTAAILPTRRGTVARHVRLTTSRELTQGVGPYSTFMQGSHGSSVDAASVRVDAA